MKKFRYFFGFLELENKWLNRMARQGWRLESVNWHLFTFSKTCEQRYYDIDIFWNKKQNEIDKYLTFLHEMGYRTFRDGLNLNLSFGRFKYRAGGLLGHFDTSFGNLNREILIVEKNDEIPLYTTNAGWYQYYKNRRNVYLMPALLMFWFTLDRCLFRQIFWVFGFGMNAFVVCFTLILWSCLLYFQLKMQRSKNKMYMEE